MMRSPVASEDTWVVRYDYHHYDSLIMQDWCWDNIGRRYWRVSHNIAVFVDEMDAMMFYLRFA